MRNTKIKRIVTLIIVILTILLVHFSYSFWIISNVSPIIKTSYDSFGDYTEDISYLISEDDYRLLSYRVKDYSENSDCYIEVNSVSPLFCLHSFFQGKVFFQYTYGFKMVENGQLTGDGRLEDNIGILSVKLANGKWVVTSYEIIPYNPDSLIW